ncbi:hypothetical protein LINGRAHAP2_LOCUS32142 [Linum grandiflorum]
MLSSRWGQITTLMAYVTSEWLPCSMKWAHCYTNEIFHIGNTSTNRVEPQHSSFKKWLNTSTSHVDTLFETYQCCMEGQIIEVQRDLDESHAKVYNYAHRPPFAFVNNVISLWAIELIYEQVNKPSDYECDCVISDTHGIPCNCVLEGMTAQSPDQSPPAAGDPRRPPLPDRRWPSGGRRRRIYIYIYIYIIFF